MDKRDPRLTQFTVNPMIQHAIRILRAAIPQRDLKAGAIGISAGFGEYGFEHGIAAVFSNGQDGAHFHPTDEQAAATLFLAAAFGLHQAAIRQAFGLSKEDDPYSFPLCRAAMAQLNADARRKVNIEGHEFHYYDGHASGGITVYR
jgi:hypothetical protein